MLVNSGWGVHCKGIICHSPCAAFTDSPYKVLIGYIILQNDTACAPRIVWTRPPRGNTGCFSPTFCALSLGLPYPYSRQCICTFQTFLRSMLPIWVVSPYIIGKGFPRMDALLPLFPRAQGRHRFICPHYCGIYPHDTILLHNLW